ncbi:hypothetical protein GK47_003884 [Salmonella enterica subsp. enterica]|nr:hypothetical protein [Salmonella enterica subsp. enterica serovar Coleypark]
MALVLQIARRLTLTAYSLPSAFAEKVCFCTHPKTFQLRTIAALPEPAGRPTHGLLSRRSTDRNAVLFRWVKFSVMLNNWQ